jgi:hypothetical protein
MQFQEDFIRLKTLSQLRVEKVKNIPLDGYRAMVNTRTLGGEGVPFVFVVSYSITKKNI